MDGLCFAELIAKVDSSNAFKDSVKRFKECVAMMSQQVQFEAKSAKQKSEQMPTVPSWRRMQAFPLQKLQKALQEKQKALEKPCMYFTWHYIV